MSKEPKKPVEEEPVEEKPVEEKLVEEKPKKVKKVKKKRKGAFHYYKIEEGKLKKVLPFCERCGPGYFMADHGDRYSCGHCDFSIPKTRFKPAETSG